MYVIVFFLCLIKWKDVKIILMDAWILNFQENVTDDIPMPPLFQFLTLLAFRIFAFEKVSESIFTLHFFSNVGTAMFSLSPM